MKMFNPSTIAIVGASQDRSKIGAAVFHNLINAGYPGKIFPVNPKYQKLYGAACYPDLASIPDAVDLVVVVVPVEHVHQVVEEAINKQVPEVIIISAGYSEIGEEGKQREIALAELVKQSGIRILGPNCLGIIVPEAGVNASFAAQTPKPGNIAFLSQSGAFNTAMLDMAMDSELGFSHFISMGNKVDIHELDFLRNWVNDPKVEVIGMYLEEFSAGRELLRIVQQTNKPVVILHPGESTAAQAAISSHTGSLADDTQIVKSALHKAGAIQVTNIEDMFNTLEFFSRVHSDRYGSKVALVTNAGGPGIVATDLIESHGLKIAELTEVTQTKLAQILPAAGSTHNPVDLLGDAGADRYSQALDVLVEANEVDTIIALLTPQFMTQIEQTAQVISQKAQASTKLILPMFVGGQKVRAGVDILSKTDLMSYQHLNDGISTLGRAVEWVARQSKPTHSLQVADFQPQKRIVDTSAHVSDEEKALPQSIVYELVKQFSLQLPPEQQASTISEAIRFADQVGYPVVVKASADQIAHKTEAKGIYLNIHFEQQLADAVQQLQQTIADLTGADNAPVLIQKQMVGGQELIVGVNRNGSANVYAQDSFEGFGHALVFGKGGIYTEVYKDVASKLLPLNHAELEELINQTKVSQIIAGARGKTPLAKEFLLEFLGQLQMMVMTYPEISSVDINPLVLTTDAATAIDIKIFVKK